MMRCQEAHRRQRECGGINEGVDKRWQEEVEMRWIWCRGDLELHAFMEKREVF